MNTGDSDEFTGYVVGSGDEMNYPPFIKVNNTAIKRTRVEKHSATYYRVAGAWELDVQFIHGKLVVTYPKWAVDAYHTVAPCSQDEWKEDNGGYVDQNRDYLAPEPKKVNDFSLDDDMPF